MEGSRRFSSVNTSFYTIRRIPFKEENGLQRGKCLVETWLTAGIRRKSSLDAGQFHMALLVPSLLDVQRQTLGRLHRRYQA